MEWSRRVACLLALLLLHLGSAQTSNPPDLFTSLKTQITIRVSKHPTGADLVEITALDPNYPAETLRAQAEKICSEIGSTTRGLQVYKMSLGSGDLTFLKATFGTIGILNGPQGIKLQPLARAFAGGTGPSLVEGIDVIASGVTPLPDTLGRWDSKEVIVQGLPPAGTVLEYRIKLLSQDPKAIVIPDLSNPQAQNAASRGIQSGPSRWIIWILVVIGALAVGAIVYNLALRSSPRTGRGPGSVQK
jgi:hypothetical protein